MQDDIREWLVQDTDEETINSIIDEIVTEYDINNSKIVRINTNNWLSNILTDQDYFIKIVSKRHLKIQHLFTTTRNIAFAPLAGEKMFEKFDTVYEMVEYEYKQLNKFDDLINVPTPVDYFKFNSNYSVLLIDFIPDLKRLKDSEEITEHIDNAIQSLQSIHAEGLGHGDIREENMPISNNNLYFIDPTNIRTQNNNYKYFDLASLLSSVNNYVSEETLVNILSKYYPDIMFKKLSNYLGIVTTRMTHSSDVGALRKELRDYI